MSAERRDVVAVIIELMESTKSWASGSYMSAAGRAEIAGAIYSHLEEKGFEIVQRLGADRGELPTFIQIIHVPEFHQTIWALDEDGIIWECLDDRRYEDSTHADNELTWRRLRNEYRRSGS
jgi:hypothetical protein